MAMTPSVCAETIVKEFTTPSSLTIPATSYNQFELDASFIPTGYIPIASVASSSFTGASLALNTYIQYYNSKYYLAFFNALGNDRTIAAGAKFNIMFVKV